MANQLVSIRHNTAGEEWRRNTIIRDSAKRCEIERRRPHLTCPQILVGIFLEFDRPSRGPPAGTIEKLKTDMLHNATATVN